MDNGKKTESQVLNNEDFFSVLIISNRLKLTIAKILMMKYIIASQKDTDMQNASDIKSSSFTSSVLLQNMESKILL